MIQTYLLLSIIIGAVLIVDGFLLRNVKGRCGGHSVLNITTIIEFLWAILSVIALLKLEFPGWLIFIPALYVAHNVFGWLYGFIIMSKRENNSTDEIIYVPMWYVNFGLVVGIVYGLASVVAVSV